MNEVKTRVVDGTNCSKQLKFGVERILSDEISTKKAGKNRNCLFNAIFESFFLFSSINLIPKERKKNKNKTKQK